MATAQTEKCSITDRFLSEFFWDNGYKNMLAGLPKKAFLEMAKRGDIQLSSIMENLVAYVNPKMKRSTRDGEDHIDGSEDKYVTTNFHERKKEYTRKDGSIGVSYTNTIWIELAHSSLKNKKGTLRLLVNFYNPLNGYQKILLIRMPYPEWSKCLYSNGSLTIYFNMDGTMKPTFQERFGKRICNNFVEFCK